MKASVNINIRTTSELKENANIVLARLGLDMSTAVNLFLTQVVDKDAIPFPLTVSKGKNQARLGGWEGRGWIADDFNVPTDEYGRFEHEPDYGKPEKQPNQKVNSMEVKKL